MANIVTITNQEQANEISLKHHNWVLGEKSGSCAIYLDTRFEELTFRSVCFKDAIFRDCVFHYVDLSNANLRHADLRGANLEMADLTNTILTDAKYNNKTRFPLGFSEREELMRFVE